MIGLPSEEGANVPPQRNLEKQTYGLQPTVRESEI
jgi:hypothetical protein